MIYRWKYGACLPQLNEHEAVVSDVIEISAATEDGGLTFNSEVKLVLSHSAADLEGYELVLKRLADTEKNEWEEIAGCIDIRHGAGIDFYLVESMRCKPERTLVEVESIVSFRWRLLNFPAMLRDQTDATGDDPITSEVFSCERHKWRGLLTDKKSLFLQLVSASHPITAEFRIVLMPGQEKQKEFRSEKTTLKEGEMWGGDVSVAGGGITGLNPMAFDNLCAHLSHELPADEKSSTSQLKQIENPSLRRLSNILRVKLYPELH
ncbi:hypothetical protein P5673_033349 [Acropora cervicornis]|uniref:Uncharacterized protein n=1 Tax=Acropora cervicornis TaxID=6130 RepID=A0AAD9PQ97_ACRCE|nr:hypothetical protein P5673_033349 [Acropora cervicornis]